jgi:hypothetical protein
MAGALDTKTDPKQTPIGKFLELENAYRVRNGELVKRDGFESLGTTLASNGDISDGRKLALLNNELNVITNKDMYTYSDDTDQWVLKGPLETLSIDNTAVVANSYAQSTADSATNGNIALYAYEDNRTTPNSVRYTIIDRLSNSTIVGDSLLAASYIKPKCISIGTKIMVFCQTGNTLKRYMFDAKDPTTTATDLTIGSDSHADAIYDVINFFGAILLAYRVSTGGTKLVYITQSGALGTATNGYPAATTLAAINSELCLTLFADDENRFNLAYANTSTGVNHIGLYADFTTWLADANLSSYVGTATTRVRNITGFQKNTLSHIYWDKDDTTDKWKREVNDTHRNIVTGAVTTGAGNLKSVSLAGKIFYTDDNGFVPVVYYSELQPTMFLLRNDGDISAKMLAQISSGETARTGHLPSMTELATNKWVFSTQYRSRVETLATGVVFSNTGITEVIMDFDDPDIGQSAQLGENLLINSGYLQCYDGMSIFESGFHIYPDHISLASVGSGVLPGGTYRYRVVYEWTDNKNQRHRSAPSFPVSITISSNNNIVITVPTLFITDRKSPRSDVVISVYRTTAAGTLYYKISGGPFYNNTGSITTIITDTTLDAALQNNETLYTTGNVVENISPPAGKFIERFKNRLFLAGLEDENSIWFSKEHQPNQAVEFSDFFVITVDDTGGAITGLATLDDKLVIFKESTIFVLMGDGPLPTGAQNQFNVPQIITTDVGAVSNVSIVKSRDGLMFKSKKGIYLLDRGMNVSYVGADVEQWNDLSITSATVIDGLNQVRFTTAEGRCLVYDLFFKQWSTFTNIDAIDSKNWQGKFIFLKSSAEVWRETKGSYVDNGQPIITSYVLSLMQFGQIQGLQRIYKINVLGEYRGEHGLKLELGYDFREFYEERFIVEPQGVLYDSTWGDDTVWGEAGTAWGGTADGVYQFQIRPRTQKCQALKLRVSDFFTSTGSAGFAFSNITAEVGIEPNVARIGKTKIIAP